MFDYDGPHRVSVEIRLPTAQELAIGHPRENAVVVATSKLEPSDHVAAMFRSLLDRQLPEVPPEPFEWPWAEHIDTEGRIAPGFLAPVLRHRQAGHQGHG